MGVQHSAPVFYFKTMAKTIKNYIKMGSKGWKIAFFSSLVMSATLMLVGFFCPPLGVIDSSVFVGVGELFSFPTLYTAYEVLLSGKEISLKKGDIEINAKHNDNEELE